MEHVVQRISNGDFILELDWIVDEVLSILDDMDVAKNNLVIFTSDNARFKLKLSKEAKTQY